MMMWIHVRKNQSKSVYLTGHSWGHQTLADALLNTVREADADLLDKGALPSVLKKKNNDCSPTGGQTVVLSHRHWRFGVCVSYL